MVEHTEGREFDSGYSGRDKSGQGDVENERGETRGLLRGRRCPARGLLGWRHEIYDDDDENWGRELGSRLGGEGVDEYEVAMTLSQRTRTWT